MSKRGEEAQVTARTPRETVSLYGHQEAEAVLLDAYRGGQCPHAWLIGGPHGIGKATLVFRFARFVLANPVSSAPSVQNAISLGLDASHPVARHVAAGTHGGLLVLERTLNDRGVLRTEISVDDARETISFFGSTSSDDGWRVCIVDTVDELNASSANALLKVLEEPPARSLFLLVSHAPARVIPTIQSRCRKLNLRALDVNDVARAVADATGTSPDDSALAEAADRAEGSVARALMLLGGETLGLQHKTEALLKALPQLDPKGLHGLGDSLAGNDRAVLLAFTDTLERWMMAQLRSGGSGRDLPRLARLSEVWEKISRAVRETQEFNLERKPLVFSVFGMLAEAMR
ncbi:DNA polymerase III subunit delta' [Bradyrhizobium sp. LHD-71]|uniref:DNA polymerase III subunit delta' n=1 Tax=Bradyrhizobium sp. LHD-71 TaxID=3072141 RepID=UPI00280C5B69|nr:DNA polymerase III subunit delta' [Bradyrhizobium sp. LHD-71]MDQ8730043.1 DNA polymerase III subunit delta' [Bradyrhizobium sp. LHD-71]